MSDSVLFDPGYAKHVTILSISLENFYFQLDSLKNFNQKKSKFKMFYSKIKNMVDNNTGFCLGSLLWAVYIKSLGENVEISGNPCLGQEYDKSEAIEEIDYSINYYEKLKKDSKYYLALDYEINPEHIKYLEIYKDFLTLNEGFTKTKTSSDLKLPNTLTIPNTENLKIIYDKIQEVIKSGDLLNLQEVFNLVLKG